MSWLGFGTGTGQDGALVAGTGSVFPPSILPCPLPSPPWPAPPAIYPPNSTVTSIAQANTSSVLLQGNANRRGAIIYNNGPVDLYVLLNAGTASLTNFSVVVGTQSYFLVPFGYTGSVFGIWSAAGAGNALVTELTV